MPPVRGPIGGGRGRDRSGRAARVGDGVAHALDKRWWAMPADWRPDRRGARELLLVAARRRTYRNLAYLLVALPLGVLYFTVLLLGLVTGVATVAVLLGFPILLLTTIGAWRLGDFERHLTHAWLGVEIPPPVRPVAADASLPRRVAALLRDQVTWTNLLYLLLKLPLGALTAAAVLALVASVVRLLASPIPYLVGPSAGDRPLMAVLGVPAGLALALVGLNVANLVAYLMGRFARIMLGPSDAAVRLAASEAEAARARATAAHADQSRRELIVNVSHELRTPVASIRGHVESLLMATEPVPDGDGGTAAGATASRMPPPEQLQGYLGIIHRETERLGALVDDLLALARAEAGELRLRLGPVDAGAVVDEVHETLAPLAWRDRSVTLVAEVPPGLPPATADRERLGQVLLNLVRNAITHTPAGGIVVVSLARSGPGHLVLAVADTGAGIAPEDLPRVFERFYRADASRARASGGFGLGLAIVRDLVAAMGGDIAVESRLGEGSRFAVRLRVAAEAARHGGADISPRPERRPATARAAPNGARPSGTPNGSHPAADGTPRGESSPPLVHAGARAGAAAADARRGSP